ncbi:hypothetical protein H6F74_23490 [Trichocoleus sp. FACHB-90]|uniref:hypothetical protein n=1 Tax=Cyanophyceae TaxID=3028117 RepID=UPI001689C94A|nr:hypothetical protein [Trichocoleus sp. FACHB-90]MBD1929182.1 hypothetical protein [Trichocoleus sp. FACHB-90]
MLWSAIASSRLRVRLSDRILLIYSTPQSALKHLMQARNLKEFDLVSIFVSSDVTSGVINGKRSISRRQAEVLGDFLNVAPELFIG